METCKITKPFLKWVGGKTQIIDNIMSKFPDEMNNYHEIFLGGGSVLLALLSYKKHNLITITNEIYAYDLNEALINVYKCIQETPLDLYNEIQILLNEYKNIQFNTINRKPDNIEEALTSQESYYYWIRQKYNAQSIDEKNSIKAPAMFIFLNKVCFRGIFREGPNGFNVPFGHYKTVPTIVTKKHLLEIQELIKDVHFIKSDFSNSINNVKEDDFVYLDPPYAPEIKSSFVNYTKKGFNTESHVLLFNLVNELSIKNIKFVMNNSDVEIIKEYFSKNKFNIDNIMCKRTIHSKKPQTKVGEVIIYNK